MTEDQVRAIIRDEFQKNYMSGNPRIPPHTHNGIDNLPIAASNFVGIGGSPASPTGSVQFNDNGSFGGKSTFVFDSATDTLAVPNIQGSIDVNNPFDLSLFSDFGSAIFIQTIDTITNGTTGDITIGTGEDTFDTGNISVTTGGSTVNGSSGDIEIVTGDSATAHTGDLNIFTGTASAGNSGDINIEAGGASNNGGNIQIIAGSGGVIGGGVTVVGIGGGVFINDNSATVQMTSQFGTSVTTNSAGATDSADVTVASGNQVSTNNSGAVIIHSGTASTVAKTGNINISTKGTHSLGTLGGNVNFAVDNNFTIFFQSTSAGHFTINSGTDPGAGGGAGVITIQNAGANPSTDPTNGGILYVDTGALKYRGSAGTVTTIAPA